MTGQLARIDPLLSRLTPGAITRPLVNFTYLPASLA